MSIQTEIDRIITAVGAAYDAVEQKGGTVPQSETVAGLAEAIGSIPMQSGRFRQWTYVSDGQNTENPLYLVRGDAWLKEHRTDENLVIVLMPKFASQPGDNLRSVLFSVATNRGYAKVGTNTDPSCGFWSRYTTDAGAVLTYYPTLTLGGLTGADIGEMRILSNGNLYVVAAIGGDGRSFALQAGEWTITAFLV